MEQGTNPKIWQEYCDLFAKFTFSIQDELLGYTANRSFGKVLDAGAGVGKLFPYLLEQPQLRSILAVESNPFMAQKCQKTIVELEEESKITLIQEDIFNLDSFKDSKPDTICCLNVIYSLHENPKAFLEKAFSILNKNGRLIISNPMPSVDLENSITPKLKEELSEQDKEDFTRFIELNKKLLGNNTGFTPQLFSEKEMCSLLESIGFTIKEVRTNHYYGNNLTIVAQK